MGVGTEDEDGSPTTEDTVQRTLGASEGVKGNDRKEGKVRGIYFKGYRIRNLDKRKSGIKITSTNVLLSVWT